jgi:RNA polymerase sigma-70 factor (ECF subfamily)
MGTSRSVSSRRRALPSAEEARAALERGARGGHGRLIAALTRRFGVEHFDLVENAVQDAYVRAIERWPIDGTPDEPERWLVRVANNALVDALRRERPTESLDEGHDGAVDPAPSDPFDAEDELRLMFLCCDPMLPRAAQVALVLNVEFALTARQIATAFVSDERTVAQRIVRAKQRLRDARVGFDVPRGGALESRLDAVLDVLYVVFSEGYTPTLDDAALDAGLCHEALRLARLVTETPRTAVPAAFALRALLCFHVARLPTRLADDGSLLLIAEQDRARWDPVLTTEGFACLDAAGVGETATRFHVEAAIAACHALAPTYASTDWTRIVVLYDALRALAPSLVVDVNRATAVAMRSGAHAGLDELDAIPEREVLGRYPYALAAYADLHASLGNLDEARTYLDRALACQSSPAQRALLRRKRATLAR